MSMEILDGATIREFVEDKEAFNISIKDWFAYLDTDHDLLLYSVMAKELTSLRVFDTHFGIDETVLTQEELVGLYQGLYAQFDHDGNGSVDFEEFQAKMREVMLVVANGIGFLPVQMVVEEGSFLKKAVDKELAAKITT